MGIHWPELLFPFIFIASINLVPILIGFFWIWPDADRRSQPGLLWAILTIPFAWITVIIYLVVRAMQADARAM